MYNPNIVILRARKGVPGIGRKLSNHFDANEVTCNFRPHIKVPAGAVVLNYGRSQLPVWWPEAAQRGCVMLNNPTAVANSVNKINTLRILSENGVPCVNWLTDAAQVQQSLTEEHRIEWLARTTTTGKQGKGIVPIYGGLEYGVEGEVWPSAPLYTQFYDKDVEFRVHVFRGEVIDYVQKKKMGSKKLAARRLDDADMLLRNHKRGWVFAHNDIIRSELVAKLGIKAAEVLGLDYAGIDILAKVSKNGRVTDAVVCESNSAPGMSSKTTFNAYTKAISKFIEERQQ